MSVKEYIDKYIGYIRIDGSDNFLVVAKGSIVFFFGYDKEKFNRDDIGNISIINFLAEHEITNIYSTWDKDDADYLPAQIGYSKTEDKWYSLSSLKSYDTKKEVYEEYRNFYKNYLPKYK